MFFYFDICSHCVTVYHTGVPGPPTLLEAKDIQASNASLSWKAPEDTGGAPITSYLVEKKQTTSTRWAKANK